MMPVVDQALLTIISWYENADAASTKQSNQYNFTIGKAKTPVVGTKVKTSYDYSSQLVPSSNYDNRTQRVQYDLYY